MLDSTWWALVDAGTLVRYVLCTVGKINAMQMIKNIIFRLMNERFTASTAAVLCHKVLPRIRVNTDAPITVLNDAVNGFKCKLLKRYCMAGVNIDAPPEM